MGAIHALYLDGRSSWVASKLAQNRQATSHERIGRVAIDSAGLFGRIFPVRLLGFTRLGHLVAGIGQ